VPLYLAESDVQGLISAGDPVPTIEVCFRARPGRGRTFESCRAHHSLPPAGSM
jgi:hypothetical protein